MNKLFSLLPLIVHFPLLNRSVLNYLFSFPSLFTLQLFLVLPISYSLWLLRFLFISFRVRGDRSLPLFPHRKWCGEMSLAGDDLYPLGGHVSPCPFIPPGCVGGDAPSRILIPSRAARQLRALKPLTSAAVPSPRGSSAAGGAAGTRLLLIWELYARKRPPSDLPGTKPAVHAPAPSATRQVPEPDPAQEAGLQT